MPSLFARDVVVATLASGSSGNCTYIGDGSAGVLVDCGISAAQVFARMDSVGLKGAPIDGVLVTHEHHDHCGAAGTLSRKLRKATGRAVPFYMTAGTRRGLLPQCTPVDPVECEAGKSFKVKHLEVDPFSVPHDTQDPVAFRIGVGGTWAGVITDLGKATVLVEDKLRTLAVAVLEFNHDLEMLIAGPYPWHLKQRIKGTHGHLSNDQGGELLGAAAASRASAIRHLVLAHLSEENNRPELALAVAARTLRAAGRDGDVRVAAARQHAPIEPIRVRVEEW